MRDDFDEIRAERDHSSRYRSAPKSYAGLWKQIALGIVVGYGMLAALSFAAWKLLLELNLITSSFLTP